MIQKKAPLLMELAKISPIFPIPCYWLDLNQRYLGINAAAIKIMGIQFDESSFIGKTLSELYPKDIADKMIQHHQEVIRTKEILAIEESIVIKKEKQYFHTTIAPLKDEKDIVIGTIATSVDMTQKKEAAKHSDKQKIFEHLEMVAQILPTPVYWLDKNQYYLGVNELVIQGTGNISYDKDFAGKTPYDLYPKKMAHDIVKHHKEVIRTGQLFSAQESITNSTTGKIKYFNAIIAPLRDDDGMIIGTIGTSIDITAQKESEQLQLENAAHKVQLLEQEKFTKTVDQVAHDIRSPLASLLMIVKSCIEIPEMERIALREAAISIGDIANNLLSKYQPKEPDSSLQTKERQPVLLSAILLQLLTDKKFQYKDLPVKFDYEFNQMGQFSFIKVELSSFKRMISNLINNSVDALEKESGKVTVKLDANATFVKVIVEDNGKGITSEVIKKIINNVAVTAGKTNGHGIGLTQVRETLEQNEGTLSIDSKINQGTKIILEFPRIQAPNWIGEEIKLGPEDTVVILDDDSSIHAAWDTRFELILKKTPNLCIKHFENCKEAIEFINSLPEHEKQKIFLLTDFELLKQELNGLHVVEKTNVHRSILVTSHYANAIVLERAEKMGTKILPKQLASEVPIVIDKTFNYINTEKKESPLLKATEVILVDDDKNFADALTNFIFNNHKVDYFQSPQELYKDLVHYSKDAYIYLDNNFEGTNIRGLDIAQKLHELGFARLYLLSGESFKPGELPSYLKVIRKDDIDKIKDW